MTNLRCAAIVVLYVISVFAQRVSTPSPSPRNLAFTNGNWFDGHRFNHKTGYSVDGVLTFRKPPSVDAVIDLRNGFVLPPFGEAHNHNVEPLNKIDPLIRRYLQHGIFYVKNPDNLPSGRAQILAKLNQPDSIDVAFSNGGFTGKDGHPAEIVRRNIERGYWTEADGDGAFYYAVSNEAEVERKWPQFLATKPDFVKTYLLYSDTYAVRKDDPKFFAWKGLDPGLLGGIVQRAHAAGLRVSSHIENGADFHNALLAGVDEINHMPGFRMTADINAHSESEFLISEKDAKLAARRGTFVVTTLAGSAQPKADGSSHDAPSKQDELNRKNLELLKKYHVNLALGSDSYRSDTVPEALYLWSLHIFDNATLLRIWCTGTARTIYPQRKIGELRTGYEASFIVVTRDPIRDFRAVEHVSMAVKQGHILKIDSMPSDSAH